jgi:trans-2,3-dihydro-3-hydroxyanthranilate isomerase
MPVLRYALVNVFAETPFGGQPLAVCFDADGLDTSLLQQVAAQLGSGVCAFVSPGSAAGARVRLLGGSSPYVVAPHALLGAAAVWRLRAGGGTRPLALETDRGVVTVHADGTHEWLAAPMPAARFPLEHRREFADMLDVDTALIASNPMFIDTGEEQLLLQLHEREAVLQAQPQAARVQALCRTRDGEAQLVLWHAGAGGVTMRRWCMHGGYMHEDAGIGAAGANLGGALVLANAPQPLHWRVELGHGQGRLQVMALQVDAGQQIQVGGAVRPIGGGELRW